MVFSTVTINVTNCLFCQPRMHYLCVVLCAMCWEYFTTNDLKWIISVKSIFSARPFETPLCCIMSFVQIGSLAVSAEQFEWIFFPCMTRTHVFIVSSDSWMDFSSDKFMFVDCLELTWTITLITGYSSSNPSPK